MFRGFKFGELDGHYSFSIRHRWGTRVWYAEPHASRWICRSFWRESVAVFNQLLSQKLINNFRVVVIASLAASYASRMESCYLSIYLFTSLLYQTGITFCW